MDELNKSVLLSFSLLLKLGTKSATESATESATNLLLKQQIFSISDASAYSRNDMSLAEAKNTQHLLLGNSVSQTFENCETLIAVD
jgi:hypothetical protein